MWAPPLKAGGCGERRKFPSQTSQQGKRSPSEGDAVSSVTRCALRGRSQLQPENSALRRQNAEAQRTAPRGGYGHGTRTLWPGKVTPRDSGFVTVHGRVLTRSSSASQGTLGDVTMLQLSHWGGRSWHRASGDREAAQRPTVSRTSPTERGPVQCRQCWGGTVKLADTEGRSLYAGFSGDFSYEVDINSILFSRRRNSRLGAAKPGPRSHAVH